MKKIFLAFLFILTTTTFAGQKVKLTFNVGSGAGKEIRLSILKNYINRDTWQYKCKLDSTGKGTMEFDLDRSREAYLYPGDFGVALFLQPGDDLLLNFSYRDYSGTIKYKGRGSENNVFATEFQKRYDDSWTGKKLVKDSKLSPEVYKDSIMQRWAQRKAFYEQYAQKKPFDKPFDYFVKGLVVYSSIKELLFANLWFEEDGRAIKNKIEYYAFLSPIYFENDSILKYSSEYYSTAFSYRFTLPKVAKLDSTISDDFSDLMSKYSGKTRELLAAHYLYSFYGDAYPEWESDYKYFQKNCKDKETLLILNNSIAFLRKTEIPAEALFTKFQDVKGSVITLQALIDQNKGKVIYFDIWSTTCAPCIQEMPELGKLVEEMKDKPVAIYSFNVDKNIDAWKSFLEKRNMKSEGHYYLLEQFESPLCTKYMINAIPRFMIIDKNGKMAYSEAKRPSNKELRADLNKLMGL